MQGEVEENKRKGEVEETKENERGKREKKGVGREGV
jgi:hypothetical protein